MYKYQVICSEAVATEMARYDGASKCERGAFVSGPGRATEADVPDIVERFGHDICQYEWILTSTDPPCVERWTSFRVKVVILQTG